MIRALKNEVKRNMRLGVWKVPAEVESLDGKAEMSRDRELYSKLRSLEGRRV